MRFSWIRYYAPQQPYAFIVLTRALCVCATVSSYVVNLIAIVAAAPSAKGLAQLPLSITVVVASIFDSLMAGSGYMWDQRLLT